MSTARPSKSQMQQTGAVARTIIFCVAAIALSGCTDRDKSDLESYAQTILARKASRIDELPPVEPYEVYTYASSSGVDPFEPFYKDVKPTQKDTTDLNTGTGPKPNFDRNREELEEHSLDALRMMGTVELNSELWGIVRSPDGNIHRVQVGNYLGRNHGKIVGISEESIDLNEIVDDGRGGYQERNAAVALAVQ
jgi:type IV pilus assembly protein PilP